MMSAQFKRPDITDFIPNINTRGLNLAGNNLNLRSYSVGLSNQTPFADILCRRIKFQIEDWPSILKDEVVVDLCSGDKAYGYFLACLGEAKAYIGVDAYVAHSLDSTLNRKEKLLADLQRYCEEYLKETGKDLPNLIPHFVVSEDAASFMERITDNSVSILTIGMHSLLEQDQYDRLSKALPLALSSNGCVVAYPDPIFCNGLNLDFQKAISIGRLGR